MRGDADLALEVVILLIFGVFILLFGAPLPWIHTGSLPYNPDSTHGLFLVLVSLQVVTMGKTPFGDLRRSWLVVLIGIGAAVLGMSACFIPGRLAELVRVSVGIILAAGGLSLFLQLLLSDEKAKKWMRIAGILRHLTVACGLVYLLSVVAGLITLFPGIVPDHVTAGLLVVYGISFLYLAGAIQKVYWLKPPEERKLTGCGAATGEPLQGGASRLFREASLPLSVATIVMIAVLLTLLGSVLIPVNLGLIPFSPDGLQGLLLVLFAVQMMALGETPIGHFKRSWPMIAIGIAFVAAGAFACIAPGILTGMLRAFLGLLNILAGTTFFARRLIQKIRDRRVPPAGPAPPVVRKLQATLTALNVVVIAFGITMFLPSMVPGLANAAIIIANGALLLVLAALLWKIDEDACR